MMEDLHKFKQDLRAKFLALVKHSASEEKFIEVISSTLNDKLDLKTMEVILDLSLATVDQYGCVNFDHLDPSSTSVRRHEKTIHEHDFHQRVPDMSSYDGDDEECDDVFIFPCHVVYDECHPELLSDYHREHLKPSKNLTQIIKLPKLCEFVITSMFDSFKSYLQAKRVAQSEYSLSSDSSREQKNQKSPLLNDDDFRSDSPLKSGFRNSSSLSVGIYLTFIVKLIKRVNKVCLNERRNSRILSRTGILNVVLGNINYLIEVTPDDQHIYLEPLLKFAFTLSDYRISGSNLRQFFNIIKNEETDLKVVLKDLERLLDHHYRIMRNIQPSRSINFPAASKTPEEIEYDRYVANSWHWRLRSKVIEYKRRRSRSEIQSISQEFKLTTNYEQSSNKKQSTNGSNIKADQEQHPNQTVPRPSPSSPTNKITPSWLECSLITPISNISPLIHNKDIKFCCTMWMSICGDLLVIEGNKWNRRRRKRDANSDNFDIDWSALNGHWLRLTSRRRLVRRHTNKMMLNLKPRKRRLSAKIRSRQAYDKEDEEREEIENKIRKGDAEMSQGHARSGRRFKLFHSSLSRQPKSSSAAKQQESLYKNSRFDYVEDQTLKRECLGRRARDNSQELLVHLVSFAMDSLTIEIWLNVKFMTFCARACRVTREGQTNLLDQVTFSSHLKANGSWSNLIFCLEEVKGKYDQEMVMKLDVIVNGVHKEREKLSYNAHKSPLTNFAILVGCERSTYGYVWKLSQINIYKNIPDKSMPIYLLGKGPDFWSFTNFKQQAILPMPEITQRHMKIFLDPKVLMRYSAIDEHQMLNWLTQNIVISYVAQQADHFLDYSTGVTTASSMPADYEFSNSAERFIQAKTLDFTRSIKFNQNSGFGSALVEAGGIESVLMSFAEVVRRSQETTPQTHALAFSVLLKMSRTNLCHLNKFLDELNGLKLVEYILTHPKCKVSEPMLESYLDFCLAHGKSTRCLIKSPKLIYHLMTSWRAWHKEAKVAYLLYRRLIGLLQPLERISERHKYDLFYTSYNFEMMTQAGAIDTLMDVLRECLVSADDNAHYIDHELVELIVTLISLLIKQPPGLDVLLDIMEFLLFLHPDPKSYVEASQNRISFLHKIKCIERERIVFDDMPSRTRTPYTITPSSSQSEAASSQEGLDRIGESPELDLYESTIRSRFRAGNDGNSSEDDDDDLSMSFKNRISNQCSRNIAEIIEEFNSNHQTSLMSDEDSLDEELVGRYEDNQRRLRGVSSAQGGQRSLSLRCSNRNYAIANIADLLFLSVKLVDATEILSEALQKYILDPRKLIILSNNDSPLVREKVLRLFLLCIRACYEPNMKNILAIYEQETKSINYNICTPIHLMARQLLKYPTSMRMIQFCYGIIVGVHDLEIIDTECLILNLETINHHLQLNTLVLLIQLTTKLQKPKDMVSSLRFILAYVTQLVYLGEDVTVSVIMKNNLIDCMMNLYFSYIEATVALARRHGQNSRYGTATSGEDEEIRPTSSKSSNNEKHYASLVDELDKLLIFVVRFHIENNSSSKLIKSIDELLLYLDLLNSNVPSEFHHLLRDRKNMVLMTMLKYCGHYEECAKQRSYGGRLDYYLKNFLKSTDINKFSNTLPEFHLNDLLNDTSNSTSIESGEGNDKDEEDSSILYENGGQRNSVSNGDQNQESLSSHDDCSSNGHLVDKCASSENDTLKEITEASVIERFKITFQLISNSVTTRDPEVIPSPFERNFIMRCLNILARYISDSERTRTKRSTKQTTHWTLMLAKLDHTFRSCFSRLVLYLLSPNDANLDERKYYAHQILNAFEVDQLLDMLEENSSRSNHRVLLVFIKDLLYYCAPQRDDKIQSGEAVKMPSECNTAMSDVDDEVIDDIEFKLLEFISELELKIGDKEEKYSSMALYRIDRKAIQYSEMDQSCRAIWLEDSVRDRGNLHDRLATFRMDLMTNNKPATYGSLENLTTMTDEMDSFLDEAVRITKEVVNDKHEQRKAYLEDVKQNKIHNYHIRQQWLSLIIGHTHERAIWFMDDYYPKSWELNPVEGPSRTRRRLRLCKLMLESRFLRHANSRVANFSNWLAINRSLPSGQVTPDSQLDDFTDPDDWYSLYSPHPLCSLIINNEQSLDSNELRIRMFTTDKIHFNCDCSIIRPNEVCEGEVSIASWCIHFIGDRNEDYQQQVVNTTCDRRVSGMTTVVRQLQNRFSPNKHESSSRHLDTDGSGGVAINNGAATHNSSVSDRTRGSSRASRRSPMSTVVEDLWFDEIVEIWDRRYQLQDVGLEIFLTNNMTYLLSFRNNSDREDFKQHLMREQLKMINFQRFNITTSLNRSTQLWRDGKLTNFDYLTCLNKLAGRSFNDLMQYPVFPFVLSNYTTNTLNLNDASNFRNLKRPMAIQNEDRETNFKNNYQMSLNSSLTIGSLGLTKPYHYGNHYSNSATVLHFLVRLQPFTQMLIQYQDDNFDQPDRTFHAIANTWQLITRDSNTDFKELIPEFFFLPEMFINIGDLELGRKQNNELVDDVKLPAWCPHSDARLFTLIHRQALESAYVSENLHHWIDLIFGYKQTGKAAVEALNVFHPATYYGGIDLSSQSSQRQSSSTTDSLSAISTPFATTRSAKSSTYGSGSIPNADLPTYQSSSNKNISTTENQPAPSIEPDNQSPRRLVLNKCLQAEIERSALETMIKTYGQMPRQLFSQPMKQRSASSFAQQINEGQLEKQQKLKNGAVANSINPSDENKFLQVKEKLEPLIKGLRWGYYVGSPTDDDIIAVEHKRIILEPTTDYRAKKKRTQQKARSESTSKKEIGEPKLLSKQSDKFHFCMLANGDVAILRNNTSLMLDYRADRKSSGTYHLSIPSARYSTRRAGLSRVGRMNLFSNMIISRQQFSFLEPIHSGPGNNQLNLNSSRIKFSLDSLNLVSWFYLDGTIRVKHPASSNQQPSIPLVQADTIVDSMTTCASVPELNLLLVGYQSGSVCAHIVSTTYETVPKPKYNSASASTSNVITSGSSSGGMGAVHFLHTVSSSSAAMDASMLGPGRVTQDKTLTGEPYTPLSLAGETLQSVRFMNKTARWLYCHGKRINCIKINVSFGIVVTGSNDGTSAIWDLNSLTYVRTIDYKVSSLRVRKDEDKSRQNNTNPEARAPPNQPSKSNQSGQHFLSWTYGRAHKQHVYDYLCNCQDQPLANSDRGYRSDLTTRRCYICASGVDLIAISDTLGDLVTVKHLSDRLVAASEFGDSNDQETNEYNSSNQSMSTAGDGNVSLSSSRSPSSDSNLTGVIYVHTINGALVNFVNCHAQVTAVCYSNAPEGISINVIVVGMIGGLIRLYSSWDLSRVKQFYVSGLFSPINDIMYTRDSQLMYIAYEDGQMVVLRNRKKGRSFSVPKEWIL